MNNKTKAIVSDIVADMLTAPVKAAVMCVEYTDKVKNIETKSGTVGSDISAAVARAKDTGTAAKQKVLDKAKELSESESGQKIIGAAKDVYGKVGEKAGEYKGKVSDYIEELKGKFTKEAGDAEDSDTGAPSEECFGTDAPSEDCFGTDAPSEECFGTDAPSEGSDIKKDLDLVFEEICEE